jgi:hypothetical protein
MSFSTVIGLDLLEFEVVGIALAPFSVIDESPMRP